MGIIRKKIIDCQDCGNPNCQKADHTFTEERNINADELKEVLDNFFEMYGYTKLTEDAWEVLLITIGYTSIPPTTKDSGYP